MRIGSRAVATRLGTHDGRTVVYGRLAIARSGLGRPTLLFEFPCFSGCPKGKLHRHGWPWERLDVQPMTPVSPHCPRYEGSPYLVWLDPLAHLVDKLVLEEFQALVSSYEIRARMRAHARPTAGTG